MHILYLTKDLMFSSRVCILAKEKGVTVDVVSAVDDTAGEGTSLAIIDLGLPQLDITTAVRELRKSANNLKIVAYGPHVNVEQLAFAEQAGCDIVLPRSQFNQQMEAILSAPPST